MNTKTIDDTTTKLFSHLWRGGQYSYYWTAPDKTSYWFDVSNPLPIPHIDQNLYFGVNPCTKIPETNSKGEARKPGFVRSQIRYIAAVNTLFGEFDVKDFGSKEAILAHLKQFPEPSVIVDSGGGFHCYYLLSEPFTIANEDDRERAKRAQADFVDYIGSDKNSKDLARVLRIPGTRNLKQDYAPNYPPVEIIKADFDLTYSFSFLEAMANQGKVTFSKNGYKTDGEMAQSCLNRLAGWRCDKYGEWIGVGMALSELGGEGLSLWRKWSQNSTKYKNGDCDDKWKTFKPGDGLTLASLVYWANEDDPQGMNGHNKSGSQIIDTPNSQIFDTSEATDDPEPLPEYAPLPDDIPSFERNHLDHWLGKYVGYALKVSPMTPADFHESAGLWLASVAIARRLKVPMPFGDVYPNLFIAWIAPTTLFRKTTALDIARRISRRVMPHLLTPQDSTPEAMLSDLAGREPTNFNLLADPDQEQWKKSRDFCAQKGWSLDEISGLLASAGRDYNAGLIEALLRLFDCDERFTRSTKSNGLTIVKSAYLALLGASTPGAMSPHLNNDALWSMGFWPRFAILTPQERPAWAEPQQANEPPELSANLTRLMSRLPCPTWPEPPGALDVTFAAGVYQNWQQYNKAVSYDLLTPDLDAKLHGTYGRLPTQVIKVATILAALDWGDDSTPVIEAYHFAHAVAICEKWRGSAHRALEMVNTNEFNAMQERIIKIVSRYEPKGVTLRDISRTMRDKKLYEIEDTLGQLERLGMVEPVEQGSGSKGGRPTLRYKLTR